MRRADKDAGDIGDEVFHHGVPEPLIVVKPFPDTTSAQSDAVGAPRGRMTSTEHSSMTHDVRRVRTDEVSAPIRTMRADDDEIGRDPRGLLEHFVIDAAEGRGDRDAPLRQIELHREIFERFEDGFLVTVVIFGRNIFVHGVRHRRAHMDEP